MLKQPLEADGGKIETAAVEMQRAEQRQPFAASAGVSITADQVIQRGEVVGSASVPQLFAGQLVVRGLVIFFTVVGQCGDQPFRLGTRAGPTLGRFAGSLLLSLAKERIFAGIENGLEQFDALVPVGVPDVIAGSAKLVAQS